MITILDLSSREFARERGHNVDIGSLSDFAERHDPNLFVFHDEVHRQTALVIPELLRGAITELGLSRDQSAKATGLLDLLCDGQMTVHQGQSARAVAEQAARQDVDVVLVVDDDSSPVGLFVPAAVLAVLPEAGLLQDDALTPLRAAVTDHRANGDLVGAIGAVETEYGDDFHSERINLTSPEIYVCAGNGKPHTRSRCPCDRHRSAACERRQVDQR